MASERTPVQIELDEPRRNFLRLRAGFWFVTACAGFLQAWAARFWISPDGNNYLDVASAYLRGDWSHAVNAYWSPLFSWLLAFCLWVFHPTPYWESTLLHLLNFVGLLVALRAFEFFFQAFLGMHRQITRTNRTEEKLSNFEWWTLGYGIFLSTALFVQTLVATTPDMWVAAFTCLIAGLILKIRTQGGSWGLFATLGFALGCAYLTKTFYFPMTFIFLPAAWLATGNPRKTLKLVALGFAVFALVAGPWVATLSHAKNRVTFGDVGKLAFDMAIDELPQPFFWQGENGTGTPAHPVRQLLTHPRLFEFATPVGGTYPPAYDTSYWREGVRPHFSLRRQLRILRQSAGTFFQIWMLQIEYGLALLFFFSFAWVDPGWLALFRKQSFLWVPPLIACLSYALVLVEHRYVAPFVLLLWVAAFSCVLGSALEIPRRVALAMILAVLAVTGLRVAKSMSSDFTAILAKPENANWQVAEGLRVVGLHPGDRIAILSLNAEVHWARLAGVKIVSEIPYGNGNIFWMEDAQAKRIVFQVFANTGAKVVITKDPPLSAASEGWIPLAGTGFYAHSLP
jgi:4-amino-4-deoxy-L-arabinose transferase-like glycosyltransferase